MNIAAHSNYTATPFSASAANAAAAIPILPTAGGGSAAIIAEIVGRILQPGGESTNSAPPSNAGAAIILTQLLLSAKAASSANGAAPMELNLNQLLNNPALQKVLTQLPPELLASPRVIEALVLRNTLLPATAPKDLPALPLLLLPSPANVKTPAPATGTVYRINLEWQHRLIQLLSPQPLPAGARVALQVDPQGAITLLPPAIAAKILVQQALPTQHPLAHAIGANIAPRTAPLPPLSAPMPLTSLAPTQTPLPTSPPLTLRPQTPVETIQQALRELLPRQQALHVVVPLLQKFITPGVRAQLPQPIFTALARLLQSLPKPTQLQTAENVKQAVSNSGSFLEANLTRAATAAVGAERPAIATTDIKAQINSLLALIRQLAPQATAPKPGMNPPAAAFVAAAPTAEEFVYSKPAVQNPPGNNPPMRDSESLDTLLTQLSKLLDAGFARIQLNQLDSASARHVHHDTQAPVPTWVLELPLRTPHGVDQLQLRIEQREQQQAQQTRAQWNVEIAFDLHAAGKLAASLTIIGKSVSATLWAEQEHTHRRVREEMAYLRAGLESVGVNVTEMQCRLGLPTPRIHPVSQQLVDVRT